MNLEEIEKLLQMVEKSSFTKFSYQDKDEKISFSKEKIKINSSQEKPKTDDTNIELVEQDIWEKDESYITAPIVGTFYSAPDSNSPPFVNIGDEVKVGQVVCIIEAMKLMSKIESEYNGIVESILVSNEQKVEYGQPLFKIKRV